MRRLERDEPDQAVREEPHRDGAVRALPAQSDEQKDADVDLVEVLIERLVVADAAELEQVHHEQVALIDEDGDDGAVEGPAQHRQ